MYSGFFSTTVSNEASFPCVEVLSAAVRLSNPISTPIMEHLPSFPIKLKNHFRISLHQRRQIRIHYPDKQRADRNYEQHRRQYDCRYIFFDTTTSISFYLLLLVLANICVKKYVFSTDKKTIHNSLTFRNTLLFSMYMLFCIPIGKPVCRIDQCPDLHAFF